MYKACREDKMKSDIYHNGKLAPSQKIIMKMMGLYNPIKIAQKRKLIKNWIKKVKKFLRLE